MVYSGIIWIVLLNSHQNHIMKRFTLSLNQELINML